MVVILRRLEKRVFYYIFYVENLLGVLEVQMGIFVLQESLFMMVLPQNFREGLWFAEHSILIRFLFSIHNLDFMDSAPVSFAIIDTN